MHEKDIELTRLLLARQHEIESKATVLQDQLSTARESLNRVVEETRQRDVFESVLAKAANLLARPDLQVAPPDLTDQELQVETYSTELESISSEIGKVRDLVDELQQKAPDLVAAAAATLELPEPEQPAPLPEVAPEPVPLADLQQEATEIVAEFSGGIESAVIDEVAPVIEPVFEVEIPVATEPEQAQPAASAYPGLPVMDLDDKQASELLALFNLTSVVQNEVFSRGHGTVYIVDAQSVFDSVDAYGYHSEVTSTNEINNRLAMEFTALSSKVSGSFHMVFNGDFKPYYDYSARIAADYVEGGEPVPKEDLYGRILHLVEKYTGMLKTVCAVTGDKDLAEMLISKGALYIPINELFK